MLVATTMVSYVAVLSTGKPLKGIFGEAGCNIYGISRHFGGVHTFVARNW